jgi:hypothetical protein
MFKTKRPLVILSAATALFSFLALAPHPAQARHRHGWRAGGAVAGAVVGAIAGAVIADAIGGSVEAAVVTPSVAVQVQSYPAPPPPPPPVYYPAPPAPPPPPPAVYSTPYPASYYPARARDDYPQLGLSLAGAVQAGWADELPVGGVAGTLQLRTSSHSLLGLELQSLGGYRPSEGTRRTDMAALLAGRLFLWNAALAPYLELAGGLGRTSLEWGAYEARASQLLGRFGVGLELRLGRHLVLDGQIAQLHRLRLDDDGPRTVATAPSPFDRHEQATEIRGGVGIRF